MLDFQLVSYAVDESKSRGRFYRENYDDSKFRSIFGRDRDRIIGSAAFRRLQYKTQVFVNHQGDHYRTRLTHSLEVAQIARWISGALHLNKDLAEIVSLAHDLGHPPFGHAGEEALNECMKEFGGFSHNAHALKLVTKLEARFIEFEGLNLSWEMLEGLVKHNGPIRNITDDYIYFYNQKHDLDLEKYSSLEAQVSAIADDIAYNNHDLEDGLRAGLFNYEEVLNLPVIGEIYQEILKKYPDIKREMLVGEAKKRITLAMVLDVINQTQENIKNNNIKSVEDVRNCNKNLVSFSSEMEAVHQRLKKFLINNMYRHSDINKMTIDAKKIISSLFAFYINSPSFLTEEELEKVADKKSLANLVSDYIAGMTDRFAIKKFEE